MILILSTQDDLATNRVIDWLQFYNKPFIRINPEDSISIKSITISNTDFEYILGVNGKEIKTSEITSYWYRRGEFNFEASLKNNNHVDLYLNRYLGQEMKSTKDFLYLILNNKKSIGNIQHNDTNKLYNLLTAKQCGLKIPETLISSSKSQYSNINAKKTITKAISNGFFNIDKYAVGTLTKTIDKEEIQDSFFPSLIQEHIEKKYELRIFYIKEQFYSTAIFSQQNKKTKVDFRNYDTNKPNRVVPFKLPKKIQKKLKKLMSILDLNSGSIDIMVSKNDDYYFLEVNPIGQFRQVSYPGNYYLEQIIAKELIDE